VLNSKIERNMMERNTTANHQTIDNLMDWRRKSEENTLQIRTLFRMKK
jgi:hypothetical protein